MVFNNPPIPDWTLLFVVIYCNNRILTTFSCYTDDAVPAQFCERLVESFIANMLCKGRSFVGFSQRKSGVPHGENNNNRFAYKPKLHDTKI